eukprot:TRINITY_DN19041_c0_g1_i1.p1 TRINITY_DN19041_c0_g1~~TRINITY_DN19041_c0_g1_i1.p1  ORF type:complete len:440 (+),score=85.72 TRINITY_DN19041_c0_g1_i1:47-1321(+)
MSTPTRPRTIPGSELDEETEQLLLTQCGSANAAAAFLKTEKTQGDRRGAEIAELQERIKVLEREKAALQKGWGEVEEMRKTLLELVKSGRCDEHVPKWVEYLQNGEMICQLTTETTQDIITDCVSNILTLNSDREAELTRRRLRSNKIASSESDFTATRATISSLPKGSRKGEAVGRLLRSYSGFIKRMSEEIITGVLQTHSGMKEVHERLRLRSDENLQKIDILKDKEEQNRENLKGFVKNVTHLLQEGAGGGEREVESEAIQLFQKAEEVFTAFTERIEDFSGGVQRILDDKVSTRDRLQRQLDHLEEMDPRGEPITADLMLLSTEIAALTHDINSLRALRGSTQSDFESMTTRLSTAGINLPVTPRPGSKRKRSSSVEFHSCVREDGEAEPEEPTAPEDEATPKRQTTNPVQWFLSKLSPF